MTTLSKTAIEKIITETERSFPHDACSTCECFLGLIAQLELDNDQIYPSLLNPYQPKPAEIHSCLGCDPCPPGDRYAAYIRDKKRQNI